jgi:hypothetical protein
MKEEATNEKNTTWNKLYGHGNPPAGGARGRYVLCDAIINPKSDQ